MPGRSCPETKVVPRIDELREALVCLEYIVQDLVELPVPKIWGQYSLLELRIPVGSVLLVDISDYSLVESVSVPQLIAVTRRMFTGSLLLAVINCRNGLAGASWVDLMVMTRTAFVELQAVELEGFNSLGRSKSCGRSDRGK